MRLMSVRHLLLAALLAVPAGAQAADFTETARTAAEAMFAGGKPPGMVVAIVRGDEVFIAGYGETAPGSGVVPNEHSLVRLASLSKLLSADVLAAMVADGEVALTDTLQDYAPPDRIVPTCRRPPAPSYRPCWWRGHTCRPCSDCRHSLARCACR